MQNFLTSTFLKKERGSEKVLPKTGLKDFFDWDIKRKRKKKHKEDILTANIGPANL